MPTALSCDRIFRGVRGLGPKATRQRSPKSDVPASRFLSFALPAGCRAFSTRVTVASGCAGPAARLLHQQSLARQWKNRTEDKTSRGSGMTEQFLSPRPGGFAPSAGQAEAVASAPGFFARRLRRGLDLGGPNYLPWFASCGWEAYALSFPRPWRQCRARPKLNDFGVADYADDVLSLLAVP